MNELLFCNKCGRTTSSNLNKIGKKCWTCQEGTFISSGVDRTKVLLETVHEYETSHNGQSPSVTESDEILREKYFYGKLDKSISSSAVEKRKYSESPEGIKEANRLDRENYKRTHDVNYYSGVPKCPTCSSTDIRKISTGERMVSVGFLGLFSKKINKSFKCNKCGYTW